MQRLIAKGIYRLVSFATPSGVSSYYLVDAKTNLIVSLAPRNFKGDIIGPVEKPSMRNRYYDNLKRKFYDPKEFKAAVAESTS